MKHICLFQLAGSYDIVVNCSALGSVKIVPDSSVYPVKGHIVKVWHECDVLTELSGCWREEYVCAKFVFIIA